MSVICTAYDDSICALLCPDSPTVSMSPSAGLTASPPTSAPTSAPTRCEETFYLLGYTSTVVRAASDQGSFYVEWYAEGAWGPRLPWFSLTERGALVGQSTPFQATSIPEMVRISVENEHTDDWGYWKLAIQIEGCAEQVILEEPAASDGPPVTFGSQGVANWVETSHIHRESLSRNFPEDSFLDWRNWWLGEESYTNNTYSICE